MATPRSIDHPYARCGSPARSHQEDERELNKGEPQFEVEAATATATPQPSRFHVFTDLARAVRTCVSYMWGMFCRIITPVRDRSPPPEPYAPPTPQDTIQGQLNKGWVPLSEHLPRDYDEVLTRDRLRCLEATIAHALTTHSSSLPNCLPLLQEVENDIRNRMQLTSAQSDATAWYMVLGTYAILASHINSLAPRSARRGLFPNAPATSTPQPPPPSPPLPHPLLPTIPPPLPMPPSQPSLRPPTPFSHLYLPLLPLHHRHRHRLPYPYTFPHPHHPLYFHPHPSPHRHRSHLPRPTLPPPPVAKPS